LVTYRSVCWRDKQYYREWQLHDPMQFLQQQNEIRLQYLQNIQRFWLRENKMTVLSIN
jgi:hypothetical protein